MNTDIELETWRRQWQADAAVAPALSTRVEHAMRMRRLSFAGAVCVTVGFGLVGLAWAVATRRTETAILAAGIWVFIAVAWLVSWSLDRRLANPITATTAAFLDFSIQWCDRRRAGVMAGSALYAAILTFKLTWLYQVQPVKAGLWSFLTSQHVLGVFALTVILGIIALWNRRRLGRERDNLVKLRSQIEG